MSVEEVVVQKLRELSPERQREVLDFVEFFGEPVRADGGSRADALG